MWQIYERKVVVLTWGGLISQDNVEVPSVFDVSPLKEIDTKTVTNEILSKDNMNLAFKRVKANKGASGIVNML